MAYVKLVVTCCKYGKLVNILDKEEFRIKLEEINRLVEKKDYKKAMEVVDSIDWRRVKNVRNLCVVGEIYAANKRYEDSREIFLLAYHRAPIGKNILYRLIEVSLKMKDVDEATEFYEEYLEVAPNDSTQYILKYKIARAKQDPLEEQIKILEDYKEREFTERWSYELAKLYYQNGDMDKCLDLCNEMILWFSDGKYVLKALDLKNRMGQLTGAEKEKYEKQFIPNLTTVEQAAAKEKKEPAGEEEKTEESSSTEDAPAIESVLIDERDVNSAESLQEKISKGIRDIFNGKKKDTDEELTRAEEDMEAEQVQEEMIKDISSEENNEDVPVLEPEDASVQPDDENTRPSVSEKKASAGNKESKIKVPELEIPESMKNLGMENPLHTEIPKAPDIVLPDAEKKNLESENDLDFNLEDTILAAATAQGIEIPEENQVKKSEPEKKEVTVEEDSEDYMTEEDLRSAEEEFLNGPAGKTQDKTDAPEEDADIYYDEPEEDFVDEDSDGDGEVFYEGGQDEDDFYEEDEEIYDDVQNEPDYEDDDLNDDDFYEDEPDEDDLEEYDEEPEEEYEEEFDDDFGEEDEFENIDDYEEDDELDELPVVSRRPLPEKKLAAAQKTASIKKPDRNRQTVFAGEERKPARKAAPAPKKRPARKLTEEERLERFVDSINPDDGQRDIIPRKKELTDNEKKLFTYLAKVPGLREQIIAALCDVQMAAADKTSRTGNVIVMGGRETGKTRLISALIPAICKELNLEAAKVAYVFAEQINGKNIAEIVRKMAGGFLVIENANKLKKETVNQLNKAMEFRTDGMIVILEDEKIGMRKLMARFPKFTSKFTSLINIPVFTNDELVNFAKVYTRENGYTIDQMAMLSLYNLISTNQKDDQPMNVGAVKEIIDNAISKSKGGIRKLKRNISKKRTNADGYVVLYERDFN